MNYPDFINRSNHFYSIRESRNQTRELTINGTLFFVLFFILFIGVLIFIREYLTISNLLLFFFVMVILTMIVQGLIHFYWMIYAWENTERIKRNKPPTEFLPAKVSFSIIIPARFEEKVIEDTIRAVNTIDYPDHLKDVIIVCRYDDEVTNEKVKQTIDSLNKGTISLITFFDDPINKPHSLNVGLNYATSEYVLVFDAEDQPHKDILNIANTIIQQENVDIIQSGVQLMNYRSSWFSTLNVLEYFFWFKSILHYFAKKGIIPLGGNSVFFRRKLLKEIGGWDETCLTEDADIGIRASIAGATVRVVYNAETATQEETPPTLGSFIRQRTRWNHGFVQIFLKEEWTHLSGFSKKLLALYVLLLPEIQTLFFILIPLSLFMAVAIKLPVVFALLSIIPGIVLLLQLITYSIGLYEFTKEYKRSFSPILILKVFITYYPYQVVLGLSSIRGIYRLLLNKSNWEKTFHINAHRQTADVAQVG